jgi:hypothetical protein
MSIRLSTALVNYLAQGGSLKRAFHDGVIDIYNNSQPASADNPSGSTILNRITYQGTQYQPNVPSIAGKGLIAITSPAGSVKTFIFTVTGGSAYTVTSTASDNAITVAQKLAMAIIVDPLVFAIDDNAGNVTVQERFPGSFNGTALGATSGSGTLTYTSFTDTPTITYSTRNPGIQWGSVSSVGDLPKESGIWQGTALASGLAGWGRIKAQGGQNIYGLSQTFDTDTQTTAFLRLDFAINTANSDMIALSSLNMVLGVTATIDAADLIFPQS